MRLSTEASAVIEDKLVVAELEGLGEERSESVVRRCKLLYIGWINNKVLLYSTGNYIPYPIINHKRKEYKKECAYMYD